MSTQEPGVARSAARRLKAATGATDLDLVEVRLAAVQVAVLENCDLEVPLSALLDRVEASLVPLLESRVAAIEQGEPEPA